MDSNTGKIVDTLIYAMEYFINIFSNGLFEFFKVTFCTLNNNGEITGLNLFGSICILLLGITILGCLLKLILDSLTPWHHKKPFISNENDLTNKVNEVLPPVEKEKRIKKVKPIKIKIDLEREKFEKQEFERLKALRKARKNK